MVLHIQYYCKLINNLSFINIHMKFVIIGAGLNGLYLGYLLKRIRIDVDIYEKSSRPAGQIKTIDIFNTKVECGLSKIEISNLDILYLIKKFNLSVSQIKQYNNSDDDYINILLKILDEYTESNLSAYLYIKSILSNYEFDIFLRNINDDSILENNINVFMKKYFYHLFMKDDEIYLKINSGMQSLTDNLAYLVQDRLYLNHTVQEITYMPTTQQYILKINDFLFNADKLIITSNLDLKRVKLNIPREIMKQFKKIKVKPLLKIFTLHKSNIKIEPNTFIEANNLLIDITTNSDKVLTITVNPSKTSILLNLMESNNKKLVFKILDKLLTDFFQGKRLSPIIDYAYCYWINGSNIILDNIKTDFYNEYNLILANNNLKDVLNAYNIIKSGLFIDKLKHEKDGL